MKDNKKTIEKKEKKRGLNRKDSEIKDKQKKNRKDKK